MKPFFSIIIPTYNRSATISKTINSIASQQFRDHEIIIVDDGSSDDTEDVIKSLGNSVRYVAKRNSGPSASRNFGAQVSNGRYLYFLDSDDNAINESLQEFYAGIISEDFPDLICSEVLRINKHEKLIHEKHQRGNDAEDFQFLAGSFCISKELFFQIGGYDEKLRHGENSEFKLRLKLRRVRVGRIHKPLVQYNFSPQGVSKNRWNYAFGNLHIVNKHKSFFKSDKKLFSNRLYLLGTIFLKINKVKFANIMFQRSIKENILNFRSWLRLIFSRKKA
jgi:glycosyltransferase involved in cell wall biosynthesis